MPQASRVALCALVEQGNRNGMEIDGFALR